MLVPRQRSNELTQVVEAAGEIRQRSAAATLRRASTTPLNPPPTVAEKDSSSGFNDLQRVINDQDEARVRAARAAGRRASTLPPVDPIELRKGPLEGDKLVTKGMSGKLASLEIARRENLKAEQEKKARRKKKKESQDEEGIERKGGLREKARRVSNTLRGRSGSANPGGGWTSFFVSDSANDVNGGVSAGAGNDAIFNLAASFTKAFHGTDESFCSDSSQSQSFVPGRTKSVLSGEMANGHDQSQSFPRDRTKSVLSGQKPKESRKEKLRRWSFSMKNSVLGKAAEDATLLESKGST